MPLLCFDLLSKRTESVPGAKDFPFYKVAHGPGAKSFPSGDNVLQKHLGSKPNEYVKFITF